jgi:predicted site-specific integrase-resolvase
MRGVIYARYSSDNQREESIEGQIRENTAFAEKNVIVIVGHYIDRAVSAKTGNRLFFNKRVRIPVHLLSMVPREENRSAPQEKRSVAEFDPPPRRFRIGSLAGRGGFSHVM